MMKIVLRKYLIALTIFLAAAIGTLPVLAQSRTRFTGTVLTYGTGYSTRAFTRNFTFDIDRFTSDAEAQRLRGVLQSGGQDDLLSDVRREKAGRFMLGNRLGKDVNVILVDEVEGRKRILAIFERWLEVAEIRGGYRSLDYPFSYIELFVDPATGKAEGSYFAAAKIRARGDDIEVEDFATFPSKLMNVKMRPGGQLP